MDLTKDIAASATVMQATGQLVVPQTNVNGHWVIGYDPDGITRHLI